MKTFENKILYALSYFHEISSVFFYSLDVSGIKMIQ